jgi:hypothetical protein
VTHVLIIVSWLGVANGAVIATQEFTSAWQASQTGCSAEDIVMPMCQSPQIPDALLQASRLPANDNHLSASISISPSLESKSIVKAGRQAFVILCVTALLLL